MRLIKFFKAVVVSACLASACGGFDPCRNVVIDEVSGSGSEMKAVVFERGCGATTGVSTHVSIVKASETVSARPTWFSATRSGNTFVAETNREPQVPGRPTSGPRVDVAWLGPRQLRVAYDRDARVLVSAPEMSGVTVDYVQEVRDTLSGMNGNPAGVEPAAGRAQFSYDAIPLVPGTTTKSGDGAISVSLRWLQLEPEPDNGFPASLRVVHQGRVFERSFDFGLNAEILWSPRVNRFVLTGSADGANGQYRAAIVTVIPTGLEWLEVTPVVERAFGHPVRCGWPEAPNVGGVVWLSDSELIVAAQIVTHSNCDSFGTFTAYQVSVPSLRVLQQYDQLEAKARWASALGTELVGARDECVTRPASCFVSVNHPDLEAK